MEEAPLTVVTPELTVSVSSLAALLNAEASPENALMAVSRLAVAFSILLTTPTMVSTWRSKMEALKAAPERARRASEYFIFVVGEKKLNVETSVG